MGAFQLKNTHPLRATARTFVRTRKPPPKRGGGEVLRGQVREWDSNGTVFGYNPKIPGHDAGAGSEKRSSGWVKADGKSSPMLTSSPSFSRERELWFLLSPCNSLPNPKGDSPQFSALVQLVPVIAALNQVSLPHCDRGVRSQRLLPGGHGSGSGAEPKQLATSGISSLFGLPGTGAELMDPRNPRGPSQDPNPRQTQTLVLGRGF